MCSFFSSHIEGTDEETRALRRLLVRYLNLGSALIFQRISVSIRERYPDLASLQEDGFVTGPEIAELEAVIRPNNGCPYWLPFIWIGQLLSEARRAGKIASDFALDRLLNEVDAFRGNCGTLYSYDWITVPVCYTQMVAVAVYGFFLVAVFSRQPLEGELRIYFPVFTFLQVISGLSLFT